MEKMRRKYEGMYTIGVWLNKSPSPDLLHSDILNTTNGCLATDIWNPDTAAPQWYTKPKCPPTRKQWEREKQKHTHTDTQNQYSKFGLGLTLNLRLYLSSEY